MSVSRRYSDFVALNSLLKLSYPIIVIPDLPSKLCGPEMETRRRDLERWCDRLGRHPVLRSSELLRSFLTTESEKVRQALCCHRVTEFARHRRIFERFCTLSNCQCRHRFSPMCSILTSISIRPTHKIWLPRSSATVAQSSWAKA